jgi:hypothetical protein
MRRLIRAFDEVALCVAMLAVVYFWVGFLIISLMSYVNKS